MTTDAMSRLETAIAASAAVRDEKDQKIRDEHVAKGRREARARAIWSVRREELPGIATKIDGLLKKHGYAGLVMGKLDQKHSDIDRAILEFRHSTYSSSKILLCATLAGEFACSISSIDGDVGSTEMQLEDLDSGPAGGSRKSCRNGMLGREAHPQTGLMLISLGRRAGE